MGRLLRPALVLSAATVLPLVVLTVPDLLADVEVFRVQRVTVEGTRYLSADEVEATLSLAPGANVWDDPEPWERRVAAHPLVRSVVIRRRPPSTLRVVVEERVPVALVATPTLAPVDAEGRTVPVDPALHSLDLPLLRVPVGGVRGGPGSHPTERSDGATASAPLPVRVLAAEVARLDEEEPSFTALLSEIAWDRGEVVARWGDPSVTFRFRPPLAVGRARQAMTVLSDAAARRPERSVASVDLRYADQVVVRYATGGSS